ncbi:unnamed protein product [Calicophoron daubneyi]|uniref:WD repeat-containing protein 53 n=1 Tax=Calicophoron daubneyi TaxID=300641 RepID=A0AAV2TF66_CALDB
MPPNIIASARGHTDSVTALSLSDRLLASGGEDGCVYLWALEQTNFPLHASPRLAPCSAVKFNSEKPESLYTAHGRDIYVWDIRNFHSSIAQWRVNEDEVNSLDILSSEGKLASADDSGAVKILDTSSGEIVRALKKHDNICSSAKFRPNRDWQLISGGLDCRMIVSDWRGTGLGVIIFELDEILNCYDDVHSSANYPAHEFSNRGSTDSYASTSEYAEIDYDDSDETDEDAEEHEDSDAQSNSQITHYPAPSRTGSETDSVRYERLASEGEVEQDGQSGASSFNSTTEPVESTVIQSPSTSVQDAWRSGIPVNPPMVHAVACSKTGDFVAAGLESSTIELFAGDGKRLNHLDSLYGHSRGVCALHFMGDSHLISGGNDRSIFIWSLDPEVTGTPVLHDAKVTAIEGDTFEKIYVADFSPIIRVFNLSNY